MACGDSELAAGMLSLIACRMAVVGRIETTVAGFNRRRDFLGDQVRRYAEVAVRIFGGDPVPVAPCRSHDARMSSTNC